MRALVAVALVVLVATAMRAEPLQAAPAVTPAAPVPHLPCNFGGSAGARITGTHAVNSSSGFYAGNSPDHANAYFGVFADCRVGAFGAGSGPFQSWTFSSGPSVDAAWGSLPFNGIAGGFPVGSPGTIAQLNYLWLFKLTTPLSPIYSFSIFGGPGATSSRPFGQPTGPGGPSINGWDTAFAFRAGVEISRLLNNGASVGLQAFYQRNNATSYSTTLPGEKFDFAPSNNFMMGLTVACCNPPAPPGISTVERLTPPAEKPPKKEGGKPPPTVDPPPEGKKPPKTEVPATPVPKTPVSEAPKSLCGPDITDAVLDVLKDMKKDYDGLKGKDADAAAKACSNLTGLTTGGDAWDINGLDPSTSAQEGQKVHEDGIAYTDNLGKIKVYPWFTGISNACAIPRPKCAATVEFMGTCVHPQELNYIQWGAMKKLCDGGLGFDAAITAYQLAKFKSAQQRTEEDAIAGVGSDYVDALGKNANPDISDIKEKWKKKYFGNISMSYRSGYDCQLGCQLTDDMKKKIKAQLSGYKWSGIPGHNK